MKHSELCPTIELVVVSEEPGAASDKVVRWCPNCGAVVVDEDFEGRILPGRYTKMRFPKSAGMKIAKALVEGDFSPGDLPVADQERLLEDVGRRTRDQNVQDGMDGDSG